MTFAHPVRPNSPAFRDAGLPLSRVFCWLALLGLVVSCYWPGLRGGFVFDDDVNIVRNESLRINTLDAAGLWAAAWSGNAGPLGRPVALLSFALNNYFAGGPSAFQFKLVNLLIHLGNMLLVAALAQRLCRTMVQQVRAVERSRTGEWAGWIVAALWGLHPLNLTGVLYVVQRMTSLSTLFGLIALLLFAWYRDRTARSSQLRHPLRTGIWVLLALLVCLTLSALSKESGLLFGPLLFWTELLIYRFQFDGKPARLLSVDLRRGTLVILTAAVALVAILKLPYMLAPGNFANRDFTLVERSLTELRVLVFYLRMLLLPSNAELSLYHDDFPISHSLWNPLTTAFSMGALAAISLAAWLLRKRYPELLFAWGWFLIAHMLESTVFPLELVHEHRNYFATLGLLMAVPLALQRTDKVEVRRVTVFLLAGYLGLLGLVTHSRALQWSNHVDWAALEVANRPNSARASYELARIYMVLQDQTGETRFGQLADQALVQSTEAYKPGVLPFMARIQLAYFRGLEPDPALAGQVIEAVKNWPYYNSNTAMLSSMVTCQVERRCHLPDPIALEILDAALANPGIPTYDRGEVIKLEAQYRINRYNELEQGAELLRQAILVNDHPASRIMYAQALALRGQYNEALHQLDKASNLDSKGIQRRRIELERLAISKAKDH